MVKQLITLLISSAMRGCTSTSPYRPTPGESLRYGKMAKISVLARAEHGLHGDRRGLITRPNRGLDLCAEKLRILRYLNKRILPCSRKESFVPCDSREDLSALNIQDITGSRNKMITLM